MADTDNTSFPQPWGAGGVIWRTLVFLAVLLLLVWLYTLIKGGGNGYADGNDPYGGVRDTSLVQGWNDSIPGLPELPIADSNFIPPVDTTKIVTNPEDSLTQIICDQLIVFFNSEDVVADIKSFAQQFKAAYPGDGYEIAYYNTAAGSMILIVPYDQLIQVMNDLPVKIPGIDFFVATNEIYGESGVPSDGGFLDRHNDEYFRLIQAYDAWDITQGCDSVLVAIVDSYFDLTNPEIGERYVYPINIPSKTADVYPPARMPKDTDEVGGYCHGSHVAGIAIGGADNGLGCSGIAPKCKWIPISCDEKSSGVKTKFSCLEGILYAVYRGADVINCSFGDKFPDKLKQLSLPQQVAYAMAMRKQGEKLDDFIYKTANAHNSVIVKSAGNDGILMGMSPQNRSHAIITVEAVDGKGIKANFSNFGKVPEVPLDFSTVSAPGVGIWSSTDHCCLKIWNEIGYKTSADGFQEMDGTSMSAPIVTGAVALLKSKNKNLTTDEIRKILIMTGKQFDTDPSHRIGPTIQIRDALDATSTGQGVNFGDIENDPTKLVGKWKSTEILPLVDDNGNVVDEVWVYFIFDTTNSGTVEYHTINSHKVFTAALSVKWQTGKIDVTQLTEASDGTDGVAKMTKCVLQPGGTGLLEADVTQNTGDQSKFNLEKVN